MTKLIFSAVAVSLILSFSASITASGNKAGNEAKITRAPSDWPPY